MKQCQDIKLKRAERETLSLKSFGNSSGNLHTMLFILDFMYHFIRGESNHTKTLICFIILCPRLSETFSFRLYRQFIIIQITENNNVLAQEEGPIEKSQAAF